MKILHKVEKIDWRLGAWQCMTCKSVFEIEKSDLNSLKCWDDQRDGVGCSLTCPACGGYATLNVRMRQASSGDWVFYERR